MYVSAEREGRFIFAEEKYLSFLEFGFARQREMPTIRYSESLVTKMTEDMQLQL